MSSRNMSELNLLSGDWEAGNLQADDSFRLRTKNDDPRLPKRMNDGKFGELDENYFDIYLQEYYLYCYSLLSSDKT